MVKKQTRSNEKLIKRFNRNLNFILIVVLVVISDQITKLLAKKSEISTPVIKNIFYLTYSLNRGSAFSLFQGYAWLMIVISLIVLGTIIRYYRRIPIKMIPATALIFAGTIGNLIDRFFYRGVIDFIDFRIWPAFNIADAALVIGAALLIWFFFKFEYLDKKKFAKTKTPKKR